MEESKESAVQKRRMEGRKRFITNFIYFIILGAVSYTHLTLPTIRLV